ncbi:peptidase S10, serine carboxypeptidase [Rhizophagus irregularis]|uniref:Carboxypeptidase n=1 Tax=Rhizophagus irregularis TaxID=588596 RepID=A0A2N0RWJ5_9GLOM|nr:peptidase S10, serine carboxypeptidase [Rhizophagus irregularis]
MANKYANKPRFFFMISIVVFFSILFGLSTLVQAQLLNQEEFLLETGNWLGDKAEQILEDTVNKFVHNKWNNKQDKSDDGWVKVLSHEAFPDYEIKLKEPKICDSTVKQYSGYLDVGSKIHFFFWFFESRDNPKEDPVVLWLNGGPGCSSLTGLYFELGPCAVTEDGASTVWNEHSWNNNASVLFLDQPINVGYSYGDGVSSTLAAATDVYAFLQIFYKEFNQFANLDFHIAGESYAGHYIPAIAAEINNNNKGTSSWVLSRPEGLQDLLHINLESVLIGNGLVDPLVQYEYYPKMACNNTYKPVLDQDTCDSMAEAYPKCAKMISNCYERPSVFTCLPASMYCNNKMIQPYQASGQNPYDVRVECEGGQLCYPILKAIEKYSNLPEVKNELGVSDEVKYESCNMQINFAFQMSGDWMRPFHLLIPELLKSNIDVLVYAGDADFICNWYGNEAWVRELEWEYKEGFNAAEDTKWITEKTSSHAGYVRSHNGLTFLRVFEAGHMVPYDQASASLDFFNRWISKKSL